jgi:hypothetical protein
MSQRAIRCVLIAFALALASAIIAVAQSSNSPEAFKVPIGNGPAGDNWQAALSRRIFMGRLVVVTLDRPNSRQGCRLDSYTPDELVCSRAHGRRRTYLRQQVAALILPGYGGLQLGELIALHGGSGAAIWGTVVLAASCPICAAATAFAAFGYLIGAAFVRGEDESDRLLYLAPCQQLSHKFAHIKS